MNSRFTRLISTRPVALGLVLALVLAACGGAGTSPSAAEPDGTGEPPQSPGSAGGGELATYTMGIFEDVTTENAWAFNDTDQGTVWNSYLLTPTLAAAYTLAYPGIDYVPDLAEGDLQPTTEDGGDWIGEITLKEGLEWSDGEPITAEDLAFTWNTVVDAGLQGGWQDFADIETITAVQAEDDLTVRVTFNAQPGLARWGPGTNITNMPFMPEHFWAPVVEEALATEDPRTTLEAASGAEAPAAGATIFSERQEGSFATTVANDRWHAAGTDMTSGGVTWTEGPFADEFQYLVYTAQEGAVLGLADGEVDFLLNPLGMQRGFQEQVQANEELTAIINQTNGYRYLALNHSRAPMNDRFFRDALTALINKEFVSENLLQGVAIPLYVILPEGNTKWYDEEIAAELAEAGYAGLEDNERRQIAIDLLTEGGYSWETPPEVAEDGTFTAGTGLIGPDGEPVGRIELVHPTQSYDPLRATFASYISGVAQEMGIDLVAIPTDFNKIVADVFALDADNNYVSDYDMYILGFSFGNPAFPTFHCSFFCTAPRGDSNNTQYANPEYDGLAESFDAAQSEEEAFQLMWEMERIIARDKPHVPLFDTGILEFYNNRIAYPFTETLYGLQAINGAPSMVRAAE